MVGDVVRSVGEPPSSTSQELGFSAVNDNFKSSQIKRWHHVLKDPGVVRRLGVPLQTLVGRVKYDALPIRRYGESSVEMERKRCRRWEWQS